MRFRENLRESSCLPNRVENLENLSLREISADCRRLEESIARLSDGSMHVAMPQRTGQTGTPQSEFLELSGAGQSCDCIG